MNWMRIGILARFLFFSSGICFGQSKDKILPLAIGGRITNLPDKILYLSYKDGDLYREDTILSDTGGRFQLTTYTIKGPHKATLRLQSSLLTELFIAPGYELFLTGDGTTAATFWKSRKMAGIGATINNYFFGLEQNLREWWSMSETDLLTYAQEDKRYSDSLYRVYFGNRPPDGPYFDYFKKMARLDNVFRRLNFLVCRADDSSGWTAEQADGFIRRNFRNDGIWNQMIKDEYLISSEYWMLISSEYPAYLRRMDCRRGRTDCHDNKLYPAQIVEKVGKTYTGRVRQLVLYRLLLSGLRNCRSFEELHNDGLVFPQYISLLESKEQQAELSGLLKSKGTELEKTQVGLPAPAFDARDSTGAMHHLVDYKGKVIYIDLWASWCGPCRQLTPYFQFLYEKYKGDDRIAFVSVAVQDTPEHWMEAMRTDHPSWLQLLDVTGQVQSSYVANSIPKFILIDKQFKIVSFDAPNPFLRTELDALLDGELAK